MPGLDRTWTKRSIVWIGPERRRHKRNMLCQKKHEGSFDSYLFLFVDIVSFLSQVSDDSGCECRWKRNIQGSKETNVKGVSDIHGSKETCLDQIGPPGRRGASSGSDRNDEDKKETCYVKRNMKVKYVIRSEESNILCFFSYVSISFRGLCSFFYLVFPFLPRWVVTTDAMMEKAEQVESSPTSVFFSSLCFFSY